MTLAALAAAWLLHTLAVASPGPAVLMAARTSVTEGFGAGVWLALGIGVGAAIWAVAALFGLALLFEVAPVLLWGFKVAGGVYLCWLAWKMWTHAADRLEVAGDGRVPRSAGSAFRLGMITQLSNPKPAIFFGAVFVGSVPQGTTPLWMGALLLMILVNEALIMILFARLFSLDRPRRAYRRLKIGIDRAFGGLLALLGLKIALT